MKLPVILFYDHVAKLSGAEILLWHLASNIDREKFHPVVVLGEDGPLKEQLKASGIETHVLLLPDAIQNTRKDDLNKSGIVKRIASLRAFYIYTWRLCRFIRRRRADIVHTNSLKTDIIGGIAGRLALKPVIWHVHDCIDPAYLPNAAVILFRALARRLPTHIISVSTAVQKTLRLPASFPSTVVHNGIPAEKAIVPLPVASSEKKGPLIGIVGRITPWKGQHVFIQAAALLRERFPEARFQIVGGALFGEDKYLQELHELTRKLNLESVVEFTGFRSDIAELMSSFDVFVHASTAPEPFGIVILEAMMESKPIVATRGGGVPEIVTDGETGLLVPMDDAEALATAVACFLDCPEKMKSMGEAGRRKVLDHFLIGHTARAVEGVYDNVLLRSKR
jgi:glycosyltransferase involved in cell wall biosynthesis